MGRLLRTQSAAGGTSEGVRQVASTTVIVALIVSLLSVATTLVGTVRWVWRQAGNQAMQTQAILRNTDATKELTSKFGLYVDKADGNLLDHEKRLTRLEARNHG